MVQGAHFAKCINLFHKENAVSLLIQLVGLHPCLVHLDTKVFLVNLSLCKLP